MEDRGRRKRVANDHSRNGGGELEDRLSSMPDPILADILSLLTLKSAVATSSLSRRWRGLWTNLTALRHDGVSLPNFFVIAADRVLPSLASPTIQTFEFVGTNPRPPGMTSFSRSISQICARHVKKIDVSFSVRDCFRLILLPSCVFECQSLETLMLDEGFDFQLPGNGISLPNLRQFHVTVCDNDFDLMVSVFKSCPRLEKLQVKGNFVDYGHSVDLTCLNLKWLKLIMGHQNVHRDPEIVINAPKLEHLHICGYHMLRYSFAEIPTALVEAQLWTKMDHEVGKLQELFKSIDSVRSLTLGDIFWSSSNVVKGIVPIFHGLTDLTSILRCYSCWDGLMRLLQRCPSLRVLVVRRNFGKWYGMNWPTFDCPPTSLSTNVKRIQLQNLEGDRDELKLISFILSTAKVLDTLDVNVNGSHWTKEEVKLREEFDFCQQLCKFPRASPNCRIKFHGQYYHKEQGHEG